MNRAYDHPDVLARYARRHDDGTLEVALMVDGMRCGACVARVERLLAEQPGVQSAEVNLATHRARVRLHPERQPLSQVLDRLEAAGNSARPYDPRASEEALAAEGRERLRRLGLAGLFGAQVMMVSFALYAGEWWGMDAAIEQLLRVTALALTLPVIGYAARPFFAGALADLRQRRTGMDVPVALGLTIAFAGSVHAVVAGLAGREGGEVYFDSVTMFVFFLLLARQVEFAVRRRNTRALEALVNPIPPMAWRVARTEAGAAGGVRAALGGAAGGSEADTLVSVTELRPGDLVRIRPGDTVPADGVVLEGSSPVNEALLTGEDRPVRRGPGDRLLAGACASAGPLLMRVDAVGGDTVAGQIKHLVQRTLADKAPVAGLAERIAGVFVLGIVVLAAATFGWCFVYAPERALATTIAVLVVTCPCALSLATPSAVTAATLSLSRRGLLITRLSAIETLARAGRFVFDKTGTLTRGRFAVTELTLPSDRRTLGEGEVLAIAAALEAQVAHPIADAIGALAASRGAHGRQAEQVRARQVRATAGGGVAGVVGERRYALGSPEFVREQLGHEASPGIVASLEGDGRSVALLADERGVLAGFGLEDAPRPGAARLVSALRDGGAAVSLLSGDRRSSVERLAAAVGIADAAGGLDPWAKRERVRAWRAGGETVAMTGDGVNDAPVLAEADVSIAMGAGADLSKLSAGVVLLDDDVTQIAAGVAIARKMRTVIKQNLVWALGYNVVAVPAAVAGLLPPWLAALGMSLSSVVVVLNSLRAGTGPGAPPTESDPAPAGLDAPPVARTVT